jgi:hypothetical protein
VLERGRRWSGTSVSACASPRMSRMPLTCPTSASWRTFLRSERSLKEKATRFPFWNFLVSLYFDDPVLNICGPFGIKPVTMCLTVSLLTNCLQRARSRMRHGENTTLSCLAHTGDGVSRPTFAEECSS